MLSLHHPLPPVEVQDLEEGGEKEVLLSQMMTEQAQLEAETKRSQGAGGEKPPIPLLHLVKQLLRWARARSGAGGGV